MNAEIGLCITGHIRDSLSEGTVTTGDLMRVCRSAANPGVVDLTGAQIIHALEHGADPRIWQQAPQALRGTMIGIVQVSGLTYSLDFSGGPGPRVSNVWISNHPISRQTVYRVATTDYELTPQFGYIPDLDTTAVQYDAPWILREVLHDHFRRFKPLTPGTRPRIHVLNQDGDTIQMDIG
jgi:2',3'-cyclic-nucleotide 2'-phosphodiesterase (5'-nucleotidase family)